MARCLFLSLSLDHSSDGCGIGRYRVSSVIEALGDVIAAHQQGELTMCLKGMMEVTQTETSLNVYV